MIQMGILHVESSSFGVRGCLPDIGRTLRLQARFSMTRAISSPVTPHSHPSVRILVENSYLTSSLGDLVEIKVLNSKDSRVILIGRKNQTLKTAQGEFVIPEDIEQRLLSSPYIERIYVHADRLKESLVAVIVPSIANFKKLESIEINPSNVDPEVRSKVEAKIASELQTVADRWKLTTYSRPKDFFLELRPNIWDDLALVTGPSKLSRPKLASYYAKEIEAMFSKAAEREKCAPVTKSWTVES